MEKKYIAGSIEERIGTHERMVAELIEKLAIWQRDLTALRLERDHPKPKPRAPA